MARYSTTGFLHSEITCDDRRDNPVKFTANSLQRKTAITSESVHLLISGRNDLSLMLWIQKSCLI